MTDGALTVESDWLPPGELGRLLRREAAAFGELTVENAGGPAHRGIDPGLAVAVVSGVFSLAVPFAAKLAERVFAEEKRATVTVAVPAGTEVVLRAPMSAAE